MDYPELAYFYPMIRQSLDQAEAGRGGELLSQSARESLFETALFRIRCCVSQYLMKLLAEILTDEDPLLPHDAGLLTGEEIEKAAPVLTEKLRDGKIHLPGRITENVSIILQHFSGFLEGMLRDLSDHRAGICETLFDGKTYTRITGLEIIGDPRDFGKAATVIETDIGNFVYKPHSCRVDAAAYRFMKKHFDAIILMPKVFAVEDRFGAVEFLQKKRAEGSAMVSAYYYALGGTAAVLKMLGSRDMHSKNRFACGDKVALIDVEFLLSPYKTGGERSKYAFYTEEDRKYIRDSLISSLLLDGWVKKNRPKKTQSIPGNTGKPESAPVADGKKETLLFHKKEFIKGFSDFYDLCLNRKEELEKDIRDLFSGCVFRHFIFGNIIYNNILKKLNSRDSYDMDVYYQVLLSMLPKILKQDSVAPAQEIYAHQTEALMRQELPYFYTYGDSHDLYGSGKIVCNDYFTESCVERCLKLLSEMNGSEKQFEMHVIRCFFDQAYVPVEDPAVILPLETADAPLSKTAAMEEAEKILLEIRQRAIPLPSGDLTWFDYSPGKGLLEFMDTEFRSGLAGLAVFFAAIRKLGKNEEAVRTAKECLDISMRSLRRFLDSHFPEETDRIKNSNSFERTADLLRCLVLVNRYTDHRYRDLLEAAVSQCLEPDYTRVRKAEKARGIASLLCTLCRYEELYEKKEVWELIEILAVQLLRLKTAQSRDTLFRKTQTDVKHPISGTEYDMCVIAEALLLADKRLGTDRFSGEAWDVLSLVDACTGEKAEGCDDRRLPGSQTVSGGSCCVPSGIGVIFERLQKEGITGGVPARSRILAGSCVEQIRDSGLDDLCRGNMSTVEYDLEKGDFEAAGKLLSSMLARKEAMGDYHLGYEDCITNHNVTLFYGLAGIGYEFLRYAEPGHTESVL